MTAAAGRLAPADERACAAALAEAGAARRTVRGRGAGTKDYLGDLRATDLIIETLALTGIVDHVPADLTVTVRAGLGGPVVGGQRLTALLIPGRHREDPDGHGRLAPNGLPADEGSALRILARRVRVHAFGIAALCVASAAQAPASAQGVIYVSAAATGANDGTSWTNAFVDLQGALATAMAGERGSSNQR